MFYWLKLKVHCHIQGQGCTLPGFWIAFFWGLARGGGGWGLLFALAKDSLFCRSVYIFCTKAIDLIYDFDLRHLDNFFFSDVLLKKNGFFFVVYKASDNASYRQKQSIQQIGALFLLIVAAVLLSIGEGSSKGSSGGQADQILFYGIVPVLVASVLSGLASALCQWASQVTRNFNYLSRLKFPRLVNIYIYPINSFYHRLRNTHHI